MSWKLPECRILTATSDPTGTTTLMRVRTFLKIILLDFDYISDCATRSSHKFLLPCLYIYLLRPFLSLLFPLISSLISSPSHSAAHTHMHSHHRGIKTFVRHMRCGASTEAHPFLHRALRCTEFIQASKLPAPVTC